MISVHGKTSVVAFILVFATLFAGFHIVHAGFGVSPPEISEDRLVRGSRIEKTIYLVRGNPEESIEMEVVVDSPTMKDWISFPNGQTFVLPEGIQQYPLQVEIRVPQDVSLGVYKAFLRINTVPKKVEGGGQVSIAIGGRVDVELVVGEGVVKEYKVKSVNIRSVRAGQSPVATIEIENTGNVPAAPERASFELFNKFGDIRLAYAENTEFDPVPAFEKAVVTSTFPIDVRLAEGEYWGHVRVYNDSGNVIRDVKTIFNVTPGLPLTKIVLGSVGVLLVVTAGFVFYFRRMRKPRVRVNNTKRI